MFLSDLASTTCSLRIPILICGSVALPFVAHAQSAGSAASANASAGDIVVSGQRPAAESSIDRKAYQVSHDLQAAAGSASDVLRNLPSVDIDQQGNVSLRGDANVQILIDGKPSTQMSDANRAEALQQLPAGTIERIEVITNPSAQYKPDGSGGIINIITKQGGQRGLSGSARASAGSDGRFNLGANASYRTNRTTVTANIGLRRDTRWRPFSDRRSRTDPLTGLSSVISQDSLFRTNRLMPSVGAGIDHDLTAHDRLSASFSYSDRTGTPHISQHNRIADGTGLITSDYDREGSGPEDEVSSQGTAKYRHSFAQKGREYSLELRRGETVENQRRRFTNIYRIPTGLVTIDEQQPRTDEIQYELTSEYKQPLAGGKLLAGYDLQRDDDDYSNHATSIEPVTGLSTIDPSLTNRFVYRQTIHAFYATFDRPFGKHLAAVLGVRLEDAITNGRQVDLGLSHRQNYVRAYPTIHLQYELAGGHNLRLSYSHRVVRPRTEDLDPYPVFSDPLNLRAGNPNLKPQETHAIEAGYQYEGHGLSIEATAFLRKNSNSFTDVSRFISPTVLLVTKDNLGRSTSTGLDLSGNGKISPTFSYRVSASLYHNQIDASNLGFASKRSALGFTLKSGLDAKLSPSDLIQISGNFEGKRLTAQGYRLPSGVANAGYRHSLRNGMTIVLSVSDIFDTQRDRMTIDNAILHETTSRRNGRRTATLALTWPFAGGGGRSKPDAAIEEDKQD